MMDWQLVVLGATSCATVLLGGGYLWRGHVLREHRDELGLSKSLWKALNNELGLADTLVDAERLTRQKEERAKARDLIKRALTVELDSQLHAACTAWLQRDQERLDKKDRF